MLSKFDFQNPGKNTQKVIFYLSVDIPLQELE